MVPVHVIQIWDHDSTSGDDLGDERSLGQSTACGADGVVRTTCELDEWPNSGEASPPAKRAWSILGATAGEYGRPRADPCRRSQRDGSNWCASGRGGSWSRGWSRRDGDLGPDGAGRHAADPGATASRPGAMDQDRDPDRRGLPAAGDRRRSLAPQWWADRDAVASRTIKRSISIGRDVAVALPLTGGRGRDYAESRRRRRPEATSAEAWCWIRGGRRSGRPPSRPRLVGPRPERRLPSLGAGVGAGRREAGQETGSLPGRRARPPSSPPLDGTPFAFSPSSRGSTPSANFTSEVVADRRCAGVG